MTKALAIYALVYAGLALTMSPPPVQPPARNQAEDRDLFLVLWLAWPMWLATLLGFLVVVPILMLVDTLGRHK